MATCSLCDRRRGNRACPALNAEICARCCGTRRRRDVNCPSQCAFLQSARTVLHERNLEFADLDRVREMDPEFTNALEYAIVTVLETRFHDLRDREVKEALSNLYKTAQTEEKGLLYEYCSADPRIQGIADAVSQVIRQYREGQNVTHKVELIEVQACLLVAVNATKMTTRRNPDSTEYLAFIAQYAHPPEDADKEEQVGRIIIP